MNDELFGKLDYRLGYNGNSNIYLFNKNWQLRLKIKTAEDQKISENQRLAYRQFRDNEKSLCEEIEKKIYEYYLSVFQEYRDMLDEDERDEITPIVSNEYEIARLVEPTTLMIDYDYKNGNPQRIGLIAEVSWEPSHGLGILIEDGSVTKVGYADVII